MQCDNAYFIYTRFDVRVYKLVLVDIADEEFIQRIEFRVYHFGGTNLSFSILTKPRIGTVVLR